jgi:hypothetical protein
MQKGHRSLIKKAGGIIMLTKRRKLLISILAIAMLLCFSTSVFAADYKFSSLTGSGKVILQTPAGPYPGNFNFTLNNLRPGTESPYLANLKFTLKIPMYNFQNQQGDYDGYDNVYALVTINDKNTQVDGTVKPGVPVDKTSPTEIYGYTTATIKVYGDGDLISEPMTDIPVQFKFVDGKADYDQLIMIIDYMAFINETNLPAKSIVTNYALMGSNQNQQ